MRVAVTVVLVLLGVSSARGVLFPVNTVIQIVAAISWPLEIPDRKLFTNTGFQFNYNLANQLSSFYKPAFFPSSRALLDIVAPTDGNAIAAPAATMSAGAPVTDGNGAGDGVDRGRRMRRHIAGNDAPATRSSNHFDSQTTARPFVADNGGGAPPRRPLDVDKYMLAHQRRHGRQVDGCDVHQQQQPHRDCGGQGGIDDKPPHVVSPDMSAGELYRSFEDTLHESGFHRSCLAKSVCQMAHHPMHNYRRTDDDGDADADAEDLMADVLHFVLTPSAHRSFHHHEHADRTRFEAAEELGRRGGNCERAYADCERTLLDYVSVLEGVHDD